jgi:hypothetical protein
VDDERLSEAVMGGGIVSVHNLTYRCRLLPILELRDLALTPGRPIVSRCCHRRSARLVRNSGFGARDGTQPKSNWLRSNRFHAGLATAANKTRPAMIAEVNINAKASHLESRLGPIPAFEAALVFWRASLLRFMVDSLATSREQLHRRWRRSALRRHLLSDRMSA